MSPVAPGSVSESSLRVKRKGFVMTIILNRPEALNTLNLEAVRFMLTHYDFAEGVRARLLGGCPRMWAPWTWAFRPEAYARRADGLRP